MNTGVPYPPARPPKLAIHGTRVTLYHIISYLKAGWEPCLIQQWLSLTNKQLVDVMDYIDRHEDEVEVAYQQCLQEVKESHQGQYTKLVGTPENRLDSHKLSKQLFSEN